MKCFYCGKSVYRKGKKVNIEQIIGKFLLLPDETMVMVCYPCEAVIESDAAWEIFNIQIKNLKDEFNHHG